MESIVQSNRDEKIHEAQLLGFELLFILEKVKQTSKQVSILKSSKYHHNATQNISILHCAFFFVKIKEKSIWSDKGASNAHNIKEASRLIDPSQNNQVRKRHPLYSLIQKGGHPPQTTSYEM